MEQVELELDWKEDDEDDAKRGATRTTVSFSKRVDRLPSYRRSEPPVEGVNLCIKHTRPNDVNSQVKMNVAIGFTVHPRSPLGS